MAESILIKLYTQIDRHPRFKFLKIQNGHRFEMVTISKWPAFLYLSYGWGDFDQTSHKDRSSSKEVHLSFKSSKWPRFQNGQRFFRLLFKGNPKYNHGD